MEGLVVAEDQVAYADVAAGQVQAPVAPAPVASSPSLGEQMTTAAAGVDVGTTPVETTPVSTPVTSAGAGSVPAEASWTGVRDYLKGKGVELPFDDDASALDNLGQAYKQLQERNYYADLGRQVAPHAGKLREYLSQQQQASAGAASPPAWAAPEFKKEWVNLVERDENTGLLRSKAGYDPAIAEKVQAYADWRDRFLDSPETVIAPLIEQRAAQLIDQRFAAHQEQQAAQAIVGREAGWLFQKDATGRPVVGQLTPHGVLYQRAVESLHTSGMRDVNQIAAVARSMVENAVLRQQFASHTGSQTPAVTAATSVSSVGGGMSRPAQGVVTPSASQAGLSLRERLNHATGGFSDTN